MLLKTLLSAALFLTLPLSISAQQMEHMDHAAHTDHAAPEKLGTVTFATSCAPTVQPRINRAVALMHSFQFGPATQAFKAILADDPACTIADWGIALSAWGNPFAAGLKPPAQLEAGLAAVTRARATPPATPREQAYIAAVAHLYDSPATPQLTRLNAYASAMATLRTTYPADEEAAIFYALSLAASADPTDKTYARQLQSGKILEALFVRNPDHPGLAHYIIHAYDVPALAPNALHAAQLYSHIAPDTPHALHMPSHTFTRVGDWPESITANLASAASARAATQRNDEFHADDYLVYAYLQQAQDSEAHTLVETTAQLFAKSTAPQPGGGASSPVTAYFAAAAIPARYALERRQWAEAAALTPHPSPYPYTEAMTFFAQGLGAAHTGDLPATQAALTALTQAHEKLVAAKENYWAFQVEIQQTEVAAWLAFAQHRPEEALLGMKHAAALEDSTEKNAITPGPLAPARELLGELLLLENQPAAALTEFQTTLTREPNRFRALYGAAHAANLAGQPAIAHQYFTQLLKTAAPATRPLRPELLEAQTTLATPNTASK